MKEKIFAFNFKLEKVPPACDYIGLVLLLVTIGLLSSNLKVGNEAKISLLLALVILVAAYNIEIGPGPTQGRQGELCWHFCWDCFRQNLNICEIRLFFYIKRDF